MPDAQRKKSGQSLIILIIDNESSAEENGGTKLTREELVRQGKFVADDAGGLYGMQGWNTVFDATPGLINKIADQGSGRLGPQPEEV